MTRISSIISTAASYVFAGFFLSVGIFALFHVLWEPLKNRYVAVPFAMVFIFIGIGYARFAQSLSMDVFLDSANKQLKSRKCIRSIDGSEVCKLVALPRLTYVEIYFKDGQRVRFLPTLDFYEEIKSMGSQAWWQKMVGA
jgi:hypothetical protein